MKKQNNPAPEKSILRQKAEAKLKNRSFGLVSTLSESDTLKLIHELKVHQVELEMQNEELMLALTTAKDATYLYDFAPSGYFTLNQAGEIIKLNLSASKMLGKERSYLHNLRLGIFVSDVSKPVFNLFLDKVFASNSKESCKVELSGDHAPTLFVQLSGIATAEGGHCLLTATDITEFKQVELELRKSEANLSAIFNASDESILLISADESIVALNETAAKRIGNSISKIIGHKLNELFPHQVVAQRRSLIKQVAETGEPVVFEEQLNDRWLFNHFYPIFDATGKVNRIAIFARDITYQKKAEAEIKLKSEELQRLNASKDKFFSIIAHDLRGPFGAILGLTRLLAEKLSGMTLDELQKAMNVMNNSAANLNLLIGNLLEWSLLNRGITTFNPETFFLLPKITENITLALEAAAKKGITIDYNISDQLTVSADTNMFGGIMRNLVSNAVKFTPAGGKIQISAQSVPSNQVRISVKDSGIGMTQDMIGNLFRIDANKGRKGTAGELSSGLGLMLCKDFVEKHGGALQVESEEGKGSTFRFTIPGHLESIDKICIPLAAGNVNASIQTRMLTFLIAEDDLTSELLLSTTLKSISKKVLKVKTGQDAVKACHDNPDIDIILMDIQMPDINGYEATAQIREFNKNVVIIAQTAYGMPGDREKAIEAGCNDYISKPILIPELLAIINRIYKT